MSSALDRFRPLDEFGVGSVGAGPPPSLVNSFALEPLLTSVKYSN